MSETAEPFPVQCARGHTYLERYLFDPAEVKKGGIVGFCWCGFCRTRKNIYLIEQEKSGE